MNNKNYGAGLIIFLLSAYLLFTMMKDRLFGVEEYTIKTPSDLDKNKKLW